MIWTAEIGSAHNGSKAQAYEMIRQAKLAGATIAKFQFWDDEAQLKYVYSNEPVIDTIRGSDVMKKHFPMMDIRNCATEWAEDLSHWCDEFGIEFMASIWSMEGLEVARKVGMKRYKIAHQMDDGELIAEMNMDDVPIYSSRPWRIGTGDVAQRYSLFCTDGYPTYPDDSLNRPLRYTSDGSNWYGYSSHMHGYADALIAVARGAQYIEKHVTLNKADTTLRDNAFALSFEEFGEMVRIGNQMELLR